MKEIIDDYTKEVKELLKDAEKLLQKCQLLYDKGTHIAQNNNMSFKETLDLLSKASSNEDVLKLSRLLKALQYVYDPHNLDAISSLEGDLINQKEITKRRTK